MNLKNKIDNQQPIFHLGLEAYPFDRNAIKDEDAFIGVCYNEGPLAPQTQMDIYLHTLNSVEVLKNRNIIHYLRDKDWEKPTSENTDTDGIPNINSDDYYFSKHIRNTKHRDPYLCILHEEIIPIYPDKHNTNMRQLERAGQSWWQCYGRENGDIARLISNIPNYTKYLEKMHYPPKDLKYYLRDDDWDTDGEAEAEKKMAKKSMIWNNQNQMQMIKPNNYKNTESAPPSPEKTELEIAKEEFWAKYNRGGLGVVPPMPRTPEIQMAGDNSNRDAETYRLNEWRQIEANIIARM